MDAITGIGYIGTEEDIEIIDFFKTEYALREFRETVEKSVEKIEKRK